MIFNKALNSFITILHIDFENADAIKQIISIYTYLTYISQNNYESALKYLNEALMFSPCNPVINYNLGHIYQRMNQLEKSIIHYKLAIELNKLSTEDPNTKTQLDINNYNGIASIYRSIKKWPESLHYLLKAHQINSQDPDINNQLGVVYTEMRDTEMGEKHYKLAIKNYAKTFVSTDSKFLLAEIYLNYGHLNSYNGDNNKSIECYNQSLKIVPSFHLPFCNKLMNLCYIFDELPDDNKMYITNQHKMINKLLVKNLKPYIFDKNYFKTLDNKINIGIVSGDFLDHPVSFFISTYLKNFDKSRFNVTCYSECIIDTSLFNKNINFKLIKNMSQEDASNLIYNDKIHILLDLSGHTSHNRLDIFAYKPVPISISYIGYPNTTGLYEIDYRITDEICDGDHSISQPFYTEKLINLKNCFLCYDPIGITRTPFTLPEISETPRSKNMNELIIGNFNRINKITDSVIVEYNKILLACPNVKFLFKTKALINLRIRKEFLNKFDKKVQNRIIIIDCMLSHKQHLETYSQMDIAIDTMVYSGTTTSAEALTHGVPVFSWYDSKYFFHASNVTASILKNSDLDFYVCDTTDEIIDKIQILLDKPIEFWKTNKEIVKNKFLNGLVCNKTEYMKNIQKVFVDLFNKHKIN
jgi:protein O-GlcNAc transferase